MLRFEMDGFNAGEADDVAGVKRENLMDAVDQHGSGEASVMNLNTRHVILDEQFPPLLMDRGDIREQPKCVFDVPGANIRDSWREPESVPIDGASQNIPKFGKILRRVAESCARLS
jgi:hypothetical protein